MGKLIRNGIEYGGGNGTDIFEVDQDTYDALVQAGTLVHNALYVITDAPNLNPTASDIEYSSGVTVKQAIDGKQDALTVQTITPTIDTSNVSSGATVECYKYGRNVIVNIVSLSSKVAYSNNNSYKLASGLPIPLSSYQRGVITEVDTQKSYRVAIDSNGDLYSWYQAIPINSNMCGTFTYISAT